MNCDFCGKKLECGYRDEYGRTFCENCYSEYRVHMKGFTGEKIIFEEPNTVSNRFEIMDFEE